MFRLPQGPEFFLAESEKTTCNILKQRVYLFLLCFDFLVADSRSVGKKPKIESTSLIVEKNVSRRSRTDSLHRRSVHTNFVTHYQAKGKETRSLLGGMLEEHLFMRNANAIKEVFKNRFSLGWFTHNNKRTRKEDGDLFRKRRMEKQHQFHIMEESEYMV